MAEVRAVDPKFFRFLGTGTKLLRNHRAHGRKLKVKIHQDDPAEDIKVYEDRSVPPKKNRWDDIIKAIAEQWDDIEKAYHEHYHKNTGILAFFTNKLNPLAGSGPPDIDNIRLFKPQPEDKPVATHATYHLCRSRAYGPKGSLLYEGTIDVHGKGSHKKEPKKETEKWKPPELSPATRRTLVPGWCDFD